MIIVNRSRLLGLILILYFLLSIFISCSHKPEPRNLIVGIITDSLTGVPIDSAQIVIADTISLTRVFYSDKQGRYQAYPDTSGVVQVFCMKSTYKTKITTVDLTTNEDVYESINFELVKQ